MATLYLDRKGLDVRLDGGALALYENGRRMRTAPLPLLDRVVVRAETTLSSSALAAMAESGCAVILLSGRRGRRQAAMYGRLHNDAALRLGQYSRAQDEAWRGMWARLFVGAKIARLTRVLGRAREARSDRSKPLFDALETLEPLRARIEQEEPGLDTLRGIEGAAQAAYFRAYTTLFAESLAFTGRNRRPPRDPVNVCLSLAYTLVHFEAARTAHTAGLDPYVGFFHETAYGRESLACDLMEPIRPLADIWVWDMFRARVLRPEHFTIDKGACVIEKAGRMRFYEQFDGLLDLAGRRLQGYCRLLARALRKDLQPPATVDDGDGE